MSSPDAEYKILTWSEVQQIIADNRLDLFQRVPSDLRRYLEYNHGLKEEYGSVMEFVLKKRLRWTEPVGAEGRPFEKESDLKILWNDWPYGIDERIVHLVGSLFYFLSRALFFWISQTRCLIESLCHTTGDIISNTACVKAELVFGIIKRM